MLGWKDDGDGKKKINEQTEDKDVRSRVYSE